MVPNQRWHWYPDKKNTEGGIISSSTVRRVGVSSGDGNKKSGGVTESILPRTVRTSVENACARIRARRPSPYGRTMVGCNFHLNFSSGCPFLHASTNSGTCTTGHGLVTKGQMMPVQVEDSAASSPSHSTNSDRSAAFIACPHSPNVLDTWSPALQQDLIKSM